LETSAEFKSRRTEDVTREIEMFQHAGLNIKRVRGNNDEREVTPGPLSCRTRSDAVPFGQMEWLATVPGQTFG
jgi:hypothetical protein